MNSKPTRNSSIEMLRIISVFVIVLSHVVGGGKSLSGINKYFVIFQNSTIHAGVGVTCFMFISGYFGIQYSKDRLNHIWSIIWICSISTLIFGFASGGIDIASLFKSIFPVITRKYWYASCYVVLFVLSPWINGFVNNLENKDFQKLLSVSIGIFYVLPTIFYFEIMNDKGKGLVHMIICYMIGRYVAKYCEIEKIKTKYLWIACICSIILTFAGNMAATVVRDEISWPFSRECTITTLFTGIILCLIALKKKRNIKPVNRIAGYTFHVYLLNNALITLTEQYFVADMVSTFYMAEEIMITFVICITGFLLAVPIDRIASYLAKAAGKLEHFMFVYVKKYLDSLNRINNMKNNDCEDIKEDI